MVYKPVIGLEIHVELNTRSKMFCACPNDPEEKRPNFNVCPVCLGHPGTLPVINKEAVRKVIKTGLALRCEIPEYSKFDRKNYFYPDLPKGYQISQYDAPLCKNGYLEIPINGEIKKVRIRRAHLEEDTGRLLHSERGDYSLVDFNRAGIPLMELVTEPDINSAIEARKFAGELQLILRYLDVSSADMEKGQMRVEVNISLVKEEDSRGPEPKLGTKVEVKNLNSFRAVEYSILFEIERQEEILEEGGKIIQETRGWNENRGVTVSQREKEEAHDYRYFPEPDLAPLHLGTKEFIETVRAQIPELPREKRARLKKEYRLSEKENEIFVQDKDLGEYFEKVISEFDPRLNHDKLLALIKLAANYLISDLKGLLAGTSVTSQDFLISAENFADFIQLINEGKISSKIAKMVLEQMFNSGADPLHIVKEKGLEQITDGREIQNIIKEIIANNPQAVEDYKKGKTNAFQFLIGQVMAKTRGKVSPQMAKEILNSALTEIK